MVRSCLQILVVLHTFTLLDISLIYLKLNKTRDAGGYCIKALLRRMQAKARIKRKSDI